MAYKLNEDVYKIDIENEVGEITTVSLDANDIAQVDALFTLFEAFEQIKKNIDKRVKKVKKEYQDQRVIMRQQLRILNEELELFYEALNGAFGDNVAQEIFGKKKSIVAVMNFVNMLEAEFEPAIAKAQELQNKKFKEWDEKYTKTDDDLL